MRLVRGLGGLVPTSLVLLIAGSAPLGAQYVDSVLARLGRLSARAAGVDAAIERTKLTLRYCSDPDRDDAGRALDAIKAEVDELQREYVALVSNAVKSANTQIGTETDFRSHGIIAANQASWAPYEAKIVKAPAAAITAALKTWRESRVVECNRPASSTPPAPPSAVHDPFAGLKKPIVPKYGDPPEPTGTFCDSSAAYNWYHEHLKPVMDSILNTMRELNQYGYALHDRRYYNSPPGDAAVLDDSSTAASADHARLAKKWDEWRAAQSKVFGMVKPCPTKTSVAPAPNPPADKQDPPPQPPFVPKGGWKMAKYFVGPTVDYVHYVGFSDVAKGTSPTSTYEGKQTAVGYGFELGAELNSWRLTGEFHQHKLDIRQHYSTPILGVSNVAGRLEGSFSTMTVGRRFRGPRTFIDLEYGFAYAYDFLSLSEALDRAATGRPVIEFEDRKLRSWKNALGVGAAVTLPFSLEAAVKSKYITAYRPGDGDRLWWVSLSLSRYLGENE